MIKKYLCLNSSSFFLIIYNLFMIFSHFITIIIYMFDNNKICIQLECVLRANFSRRNMSTCITIIVLTLTCKHVFDTLLFHHKCLLMAKVYCKSRFMLKSPEFYICSSVKLFVLFYYNRI